MSNGAALHCEAVSKTFSESDLTVEVLKNVSVSVGQGETVAIVGSSGSGKSTLLHIMGGLDEASTGRVTVAGKVLAELSEKERSRLRNEQLGFVYQFHHLLPEFTAQENVAMPLMIRGVAVREANAVAAEILSQVGLETRLRHKPGELSGGERQRAAVARALVTRPACLLADEPTGNLDRRVAQEVFGLMLKLNAASQTALVVVTHDMQLAAQMQTVYELVDGKLRAR